MIPDYFVDDVIKITESKVKELSKIRQKLYYISPWLVRTILEVALDVLRKYEGR